MSSRRTRPSYTTDSLCLLVVGGLVVVSCDRPARQEYNDNCKEVRDLEQLSADTKVSWASTPRYGPFKSRDFVTAVHYRTLEDGTMMVINRPVEHPAARWAGRQAGRQASNVVSAWVLAGA